MLCHDFVALVSNLKLYIDHRPGPRGCMFSNLLPYLFSHCLLSKLFMTDVVSYLVGGLCQPEAVYIPMDPKGGGHGRGCIYFSGSELIAYIVQHTISELMPVETGQFEFCEHVPMVVAQASKESDLLFARLPLEILIPRLHNTVARNLI